MIIAAVFSSTSCSIASRSASQFWSGCDRDKKNEWTDEADK